LTDWSSYAIGDRYLNLFLLFIFVLYAYWGCFVSNFSLGEPICINLYLFAFAFILFYFILFYLCLLLIWYFVFGRSAQGLFLFPFFCLFWAQIDWIIFLIIFYVVFGMPMMMRSVNCWKDDCLVIDCIDCIVDRWLLSYLFIYLFTYLFIIILVQRRPADSVSQLILISILILILI